MVDSNVVGQVPYILILVAWGRTHLRAAAHAANSNVTVLILVMTVVMVVSTARDV